MEDDFETSNLGASNRSSADIDDSSSNGESSSASSEASNQPSDRELDSDDYEDDDEESEQRPSKRISIHEVNVSRYNKEFAEKMMSVGLMPSTTGKPGGKTVGQKMSDYFKPT